MSLLHLSWRTAGHRLEVARQVLVFAHRRCRVHVRRCGHGWADVFEAHFLLDGVPQAVVPVVDPTCLGFFAPHPQRHFHPVWLALSPGVAHSAEHRDNVHTPPVIGQFGIQRWVAHIGDPFTTPRFQHWGGVRGDPAVDLSHRENDGPCAYRCDAAHPSTSPLLPPWRRLWLCILGGAPADTDTEAPSTSGGHWRPCVKANEGAGRQGQRDGGQ
mmetsp:Transcript_32256/g.97221  ORF Transcript_32256/g.97221 Transcript_32256/m.97221 type:complete len:214 (+) Transcript_32256:1161-1802(+)